MQIHHCSDLRREHGPARDSGKINNGLVCVLLSLGLAGFTGGGVIWPSPCFMYVSGVPQLAGFPEASTEPLPKLFLEDNEGLEPLVLPIPPLPLSSPCPGLNGHDPSPLLFYEGPGKAVFSLPEVERVHFCLVLLGLLLVVIVCVF